MNKIINIKSRKAIDEIEKFKEKKYDMLDVRFENTNLKDLNSFVGFELFSKNDLFVNSITLWELMQPLGSRGAHNYHQLLPEDIFNVLNNLNNPEFVLKVKYGRYAIIPVCISSFNEPLMVIIEIGSGLKENIYANVNRIVTIYPKSDIRSIVKRVNNKNILYIKK